jgi:DNA-directed RNA polymerase subunit RPC12/RpoP
VSTHEPHSNPKTVEACPHCGQKLSPWQQVLLNVDRALMCRNCWYRILLDVYEEGPDGTPSVDSQPPKEK